MLSQEQERDLYTRMWREVHRLDRLRRWLASRLPANDSIIQSVNQQIRATLRTCEACARTFEKKEYSRHRKWARRWEGG